MPGCVTPCAHLFCTSLSRHSLCVFVGTRRSIKGGIPPRSRAVKVPKAPWLREHLTRSLGYVSSVKATTRGGVCRGVEVLRM